MERKVYFARLSLFVNEGHKEFVFPADDPVEVENRIEKLICDSIISLIKRIETDKFTSDVLKMIASEPQKKRKK